MYAFDNSDIPEYTPTKFVQSAAQLSDAELIKELLGRNIVATVYAEKTVPLKLTMYSPDEQAALKAGFRQELAHGIGRKILANRAFEETIVVQPKNTYQQTLTLSAWVLDRRRME